MGGEIAGIKAVDAVGVLSVEVDLLQNASVRSGAVMEQIQQIETGGVLMGGEAPLVPGELKGKRQCGDQVALLVSQRGGRGYGKAEQQCLAGINIPHGADGLIFGDERIVQAQTAADQGAWNGMVFRAVFVFGIDRGNGSGIDQIAPGRMSHRQIGGSRKDIVERVGHDDAGVQKLCGAVDHLLKRGGTGSAAEQLVIICAAAIMMLFIEI